MSYGRVLLSHFPFEPNFPGMTDSEGKPRPSLVGMVLEELVSLGASELVADQSARRTLEDQAPPELHRRIRYIDRSASDKRHAAFFAGIIDELNVEADPHKGVVGVKGALSDELKHAFNVVYMLSPDFLVGLDHEVQVEFPARAVASFAAQLRGACRDPSNRAKLAAFEGLLSVYEAASVPGLSPRDAREATLVGAFAQLLEEDLYKALSAESYRLGIPSKARQAVSAMKRISSDLLHRTPLRQLFSLGARGIAIATQLPVPSADEALALVSGAKYLPPLVDVYSPINRAYERFKAMEHDDSERQGGKQT